MQIRPYLDQVKVSVKKMADDIGVNEQYLYRVIRGISNPSHSLSKKICEWSGGKIKTNKIRKCNRNCGENCLCSE